ncbi:MAG: ABC transporter ATP-binding protein [Clostridia bacterium]|nr:ABC transporter ATP-binding protein [Clostridia bacterium]MBR6006482.1 ABC transporter ATP-binding protein [Clostridia bacterium]
MTPAPKASERVARGPGANNRNRFAKPKNAKGTFLRLLGYFKNYKATLAVVVFCIIIAALANVTGTALLRPLVDDFISPMLKEGATPERWAAFAGQILKMAIVYLTGIVCVYLNARLMINVSTGVLLDIRKEMFRKMQKLPIKYFDSRTHGEIMSRYTNDTDAMREMLGQSIPNLIDSFFRVSGVFIMMLILSPALTVVTVVMLVLMILVVKTLGKKSGAFYKKRQAALGVANGYIEEMSEGAKVVKVFCREEKIDSDFAVLNDNLRKAEAGANTWASILMPIMGNLSYIQYAITALLGTLMVVAGLKGNYPGVITLTAGALVSFLQYTRNFSRPITMMSQQFNSILSALAGAERIFALIDEKPEEDEGRIRLVNAEYDENGELRECGERTDIWGWKAPDGTLTRVRGDVRFHNVTFSYDGEKTVLDDISLYAKPGQKIAFVGSTGAGKTTITNLINRFYDIQEGEITYDGFNIRDIGKDDLRKSLAMVLQDTHLFTGTVRENIRYGRKDATDEEVERAAKLANAHSFIMHLPERYDTMIVDDGENLSQGQRQLLAIARAAVADPPVLILDEATSSIDTRTEALIEKGMDELMNGRTVFVIAHRLSTVRNSNAIMVLEHGKIIERGDHKELIAQKGRYYKLYTGAFELS